MKRWKLVVFGLLVFTAGYYFVTKELWVSVLQYKMRVWYLQRQSPKKV